ncbi:MAG TPA: methyl-accepting chemotaxis protein [Halomonas sp.]|nr:methyl-accepting chemotaxis protein [Halomonas sp.]
MRNNQPVTQQEYVLDDDHILISRTDLEGNITYANPAFIEVSGFSAEELLGAPQNIVRHPDMPEAVFANFWETLRAGQNWRGLVKNRRKNGDHYWVAASVVPIMVDGEVAGYASVRLKPERDEIERAEAAYARMQAGKSRHVLKQGRLHRRGLTGRFGRLNMRSLRARMVSMVSVAVLLLIASGALGLYGVKLSGDRLLVLDRDGLQDVARLQQIGQLAIRAHQMLTGDRFGLLVNKDQHSETLDEIEASLKTIWSDYRARAINHNPTADAFATELAAYRDEGIQQAIDLFASEDEFDIITKMPPHIEAMQEQGEGLISSINTLIEQKRDAAGVLAQEARDSQQKMLIALALLLGVGLLILVPLSILTLNAVLRPLRESQAFSLQITSGNLAADVPRRRNDELGRLVETLDIMRKSIASIVSDVNGGINIVTPATRDIARGNQDLSARTEQQAASLQQTASSMEEMTTTVRHNTDNARQAGTLAEENASRSSESGQLMQQVVTTMGEITDSSKKMTEIVDLIDSIAFQTNILALNASVEAARAGEQGRGFAVVAQEVRNLASRSASAATDIRTLIDGSAHQVEDGAALIRQAETSVAQVVDASTRLNDILGEITAASDEQSSGIGQINQAVAEMDQVTQQNAARVQTSARAAAELEHQAELLTNAVAAFRVQGAGFERVPSASTHDTLPATAQSDSSLSPEPGRDAENTGAKQQTSGQRQDTEEWEEF